MNSGYFDGARCHCQGNVPATGSWLVRIAIQEKMAIPPAMKAIAFRKYFTSSLIRGVLYHGSRENTTPLFRKVHRGRCLPAGTRGHKGLPEGA